MAKKTSKTRKRKGSPHDRMFEAGAKAKSKGKSKKDIQKAINKAKRGG